MTKRRAMVVPSLPPERGGVGDYTLGLVRALQGDAARVGGGEPWTLLAAKGAAASAELLRGEGLDVVDLPSADVQLLHALERSEANVLVVQYVGYGYDTGGVPRTLVASLARWRKERAGRRLVVMLHELWALGPPWTRAFWSHRAQRKTTQQIAQAADAVLVSTPYAQGLLRETCRVDAALVPIPSVIAVAAGARRAEVAARPGGALRILVFGLRATRMHALRCFAPLLNVLAERGRVGVVVLAGSGLRAGEEATPEARFLSIFAPALRVQSAGEGSSAEISLLHAGADLALSPTPSNLVTKSSAAMVALSHGVPLVVPAGGGPCPLTRGAELFILDAQRSAPGKLVDAFDEKSLAAVGAGGRAWYEANASWPVQVERWSRALGGSAPAAGSE